MNDEIVAFLLIDRSIVLKVIHEIISPY